MPKHETNLFHYSNVFGLCSVLQSCSSSRENNNCVFKFSKYLNSDLNSDFQHENFNFRLLQGATNFLFEHGFKGFGTWRTTLANRLPIGDANFLVTPESPKI